MRTTRIITRVAPLAALLSAAALGGAATAAPSGAAQGPHLQTAPTWPAHPQPVGRPIAVSHSPTRPKPQGWTPTKTQIRSALAQERYYMSFGRHVEAP